MKQKISELTRTKKKIEEDFHKLDANIQPRIRKAEELQRDI